MGLIPLGRGPPEAKMKIQIIKCFSLKEVVIKMAVRRAERSQNITNYLYRCQNVKTKFLK